MKTSLQIIGHLLRGAAWAGAVLLLAAQVSAQNLFVANGLGGTIMEITTGGAIKSFASRLSDPRALAFDSAGDLFVAAQSSGDIYEFINNNGVLSSNAALYASGFDYPNGLAFNSAGELFTSSLFSSNIVEISPDGTQNIFVSGLAEPEGLAFNSAGDLFVTTYGGAIYEISPSGVTNIFASGLAAPLELAFNNKGDLFVANGLGGDIYEFTTNGVQSTFASGSSFSPLGLTFNGAGNLFVTDENSGDIYEFATNGMRNTFASGMDDPDAIAFQPVPELQGAATNGTFELTVLMPSPYYSTIVQASTDLLNWTNIYTNTPPFTLADSIAASRFYRAGLDTNSY